MIERETSTKGRKSVWKIGGQLASVTVDQDAEGRVTMRLWTRDELIAAPVARDLRNAITEAIGVYESWSKVRA